MSEATAKRAGPRRARPADRPAPLVQTVRWMGLVAHVPADWQIIRHGLNPLKGSLHFMDRREQRMQLTWTRCRTRPAIERLLSDYQAAQLQRDPDARFTDFDAPGGWQAKLRQFDEARGLIRAVRYEEAEDELIELVLSVTDDHAGHTAARDLLAGIEVEAATESARQWQAFGLNVTTPQHWRLSRTHARPGDAMLAFEAQSPAHGKKRKPTGQICEIHRMAMARHWFDGPEAWLRRELSKTPFELEPAPHGVHEGYIARSAVEPSPWARLSKRTRRRVDWLWHCSAEDAVYHLKILAPPKDTLDPEVFTVRCCPDGVATHEHDDG